jgi:hypothetical protein
LRVFGPNPPRLAFRERTAPHHHHHHLYTTVPPLRTVPRCRFTRRARNRATAARLRVFGPTPHPRPVFRERTAPPPPPSPHRHHRTTPTYHLLLLFHTACPQPSHGCSAVGFGPTPHPRLAFRKRTAPHHHHHIVRATVPPYTPSPTAVPHGAPTTEPRRVLAQTPPLRVSRAHSPTTTITSYAPPCHPTHHPPPLFHMAHPKSSPSGSVLGS